MKVKQVYNPDFDFICGYTGGFDDVPTKQDKFKPIADKTLYCKNENGDEVELEGEFYVLNNKAKESLKKFENKFMPCIDIMLTEVHPYKKPIQLEAVIRVSMSEKRLKNVDIDNLAKCILDFMVGRVFEDDSQIRSLFITKAVIKDKLVPQLSGVTVGLRILDMKPSLLSGLTFYEFVEISDEEYEEAKNNNCR